MDFNEISGGVYPNGLYDAGDSGLEHSQSGRDAEPLTVGGSHSGSCRAMCDEHDRRKQDIHHILNHGCIRRILNCNPSIRNSVVDTFQGFRIQVIQKVEVTNSRRSKSYDHGRNGDRNAELTHYLHPQY